MFIRAQRIRSKRPEGSPTSWAHKKHPATASNDVCLMLGARFKQNAHVQDSLT